MKWIELGIFMKYLKSVKVNSLLDMYKTVAFFSQPMNWCYSISDGSVKNNLWEHPSSCWRRIKWKDLPGCDLYEAYCAVLVIFVSQATNRVIEQVLKHVVLLPFTTNLFPITSERIFFIYPGFGTQTPSRIPTQIPLRYCEG